MRKLLLASLFVLAWLSPSWGQQSQGPLEQRIAVQIGNLFIQNASQALQLEQLQIALAAAQARVKALESQPPTHPAPIDPKE